MADEESRATDRMEVANAVVIALSGLLISFAAYQSDLWSGEENVQFSRANILYTQAARTWDRANVQRSVDVQIFSHWLDAVLHKDAELAGLYASRVPPDARKAFEAWQAQDPVHNPAAASSPLAMPQYTPAAPVQAAAMERQADAAFRDGRRARRAADSYAQAGTILATSLFFAGISQVFRLRGTQKALLVLAVIACLLGVLRLVSLPMMSLFSMSG